jgi:hypothetical protein
MNASDPNGPQSPPPSTQQQRTGPHREQCPGRGLQNDVLTQVLPSSGPEYDWVDGNPRR